MLEPLPGPEHGRGHPGPSRTLGQAVGAGGGRVLGSDPPPPPRVWEDTRSGSLQAELRQRPAGPAGGWVGRVHVGGGEQSPM